jgi:hypothetical protein
LRVTGNVGSDIVKLVPVNYTASIDTGKVPVEISVTVCVAAPFTRTMPNPTLVSFNAQWSKLAILA